MKNAIRKFSAVPSFRKVVAGASAAGALLLSSSTWAAVGADAATAIADAGAQGEAAGSAVIGVVCAVCVVGLIIAIVRKV